MLDFQGGEAPSALTSGSVSSPPRAALPPKSAARSLKGSDGTLATVWLKLWVVTFYGGLCREEPFPKDWSFSLLSWGSYFQRSKATLPQSRWQPCLPTELPWSCTVQLCDAHWTGSCTSPCCRSVLFLPEGIRNSVCLCEASCQEPHAKRPGGGVWLPGDLHQ